MLALFNIVKFLYSSFNNFAIVCTLDHNLILYEISYIKLDIVIVNSGIRQCTNQMEVKSEASIILFIHFVWQYDILLISNSNRLCFYFIRRIFYRNYFVNFDSHLFVLKKLKNIKKVTLRLIFSLSVRKSFWN